MAAGETRDTLGTLRAARAAHRMAADVAASRIEHLHTARCPKCGRQFAPQGASAGGLDACPACSTLRVLAPSRAAARAACFIRTLCTELGLPLPDMVVLDPCSDGASADVATIEPDVTPAAAEAWQFDGRHLQVLVCTQGSAYRPALCSSAFPFLPIPDVEDLLVRTFRDGDGEATRSFREWARALGR
jgi:hypothetical protein